MSVKRSIVTVVSTALAVGLAVALFLRPSRTIHPDLPMLAEPARIPPALRAVLKNKMARHGEQMSDLVLRVVVLDSDGAARAAGAIFDEPALARPILGDELNQLLPEPFFAFQSELRDQARRVVAAAAANDAEKLRDELGRLTRTCMLCHETYLRDTPAAPPPAKPSPPERR